MTHATDPTSGPEICSQCGNRLPGNAPGGICPRCLLQAGLEDATGERRTSDGDAPTNGSSTDDERVGIGSRVRYFGQYELLGEAGRGGMGVVYRARQLNLNRVVALKMILAGELASDDDVARFHAEAEAAGNLRHPNIVAIHEIGEQDRQHYFSMDYVEGRSLAEMIRSQPLPHRQAARYLQIISEAVAYAHRQGTLHRDLKPSNVLIDHDDQPRITDFGLAKRIDDTTTGTETGRLLGTPNYMSPEQASGRREQLGPASDVHALGAMLYEMLTGRPPFLAATPMETIMGVLHHEPVAPRQLQPSIPRDLETICLKCLQKVPSARYSSATELAEDLRRLLRGEPIQARPIGRLERGWRWARRQRRSIAVAGLAAAASLLILVLGVTTWRVYDWWHRGYVVLKTAAPPMTAEILDADTGALVRRTSLPTPDPLPLRAGAYTVRASAPWRLSADYQLDVQQGSAETPQQFDVHTADSHSAEPIRSSGQMEVLALDDRADVVVLDLPRRIERRDGRSGELIWELDLKEDAPVAFEVLNSESHCCAWKHCCAARQPGASALVNPPPDLNGDGVGDLVWPLAHTAALLAVSGSDGRVLWFSADRPPSMANARHAKAMSPFIADADADGTPDVISVFAVERASQDPSSTSPGRFNIEAISGTDGRSLWRHSIEPQQLVTDGQEVPEDARWFTHVGGSAGDPNRGPWRLTGDWIAAPYPARLVQVDEQKAVAVCAGQTITLLDLSSGDVLMTPIELDRWPVREPQIADLNGDDHHELLLVYEVPQSSRTRPPQMELVAYSLSTGQPLWRSPFLAQWGRIDLSLPQSWPLVVDLDEDGADEVIVPDLQSGLFGLRLIDGTSGRSRWTYNVSPNQVEQFIVGPDLDGDGWRDVMVAWFDEDSSITYGPVGKTGGGEYSNLIVEAVSGRASEVLWRWNTKVRWEQTGGLESPLRWWKRAAAETPQLLVSYRGPKRNADWTASYSLRARDGRLMHVIPEAFDPRTADMDGDGAEELYFHYSDRKQTAPVLRELRVIGGGAADIWRRFGRWLPAADFDGDGTPDLISAPENERTPAAISGRDGRLLWRSAQRWSRYAHHEPRTHATHSGPQGDFNGDGLPDMVALAEGRGMRWTKQLKGLSGSDGSLLWTAKGIPGLTKLLSLQVIDTDQDARREVLALFTTLESSPDRSPALAICLLDASDGHTIWQRTLCSWNATDHIGSQLRLDPVPVDLNGDQVLDLVVAAPTKDRGRQLIALDGPSGDLLWTAALAIPTDTHFGRLLHSLPRPVVTDIGGDGDVDVVVLDYASDADRSSVKRRRSELLVFSGATGDLKWKHEGPFDPGAVTTFDDERKVTNRPRPIPIRLADDRHGVCIWNWSQRQIEVVGSDGVPFRKIRLQRPHENTFRVWASDVSGDGYEELLYFDQGRLHVTRPDDDGQQWTWPVPDERATILQRELSQATHDPDGAAMDRSDEQLVWVGVTDRVIALRDDGTLRYEATGRGTPLAVIRQDLDQVAPAVVFDAVGQFTLCRPSMPRLKPPSSLETAR